MKFPWKLLVTSLLVSVILRPVFSNDADYVFACFISGGVLGWLEAKYKIGLM